MRSSIVKQALRRKKHSVFHDSDERCEPDLEAGVDNNETRINQHAIRPVASEERAAATSAQAGAFAVQGIDAELGGDSLYIEEDDRTQQRENTNENNEILLEASLVDENAQEAIIESRVRQELEARERAAANNIVRAQVVEEHKSNWKRRVLIGALLLSALLGLTIGLALRPSKETDPPDEVFQEPPAAPATSIPESTDRPQVTMAPTGPLTWQLVTTLSGNVTNDRYGANIDFAANGQVVALGAPFSITDPNSTGYVEVFMDDNKGGEWKLRGQRIHGPDKSKGQVFGKYVSLSHDGSVLLVYSESVIALYRLDVDTMEWKLGNTIDATSNMFVADNLVSAQLSKSGQYVVVSSRFHTGTVYLQVFDITQASLVQRGGNITVDGSGQEFGYSLAISYQGDMIAIGGATFAMAFQYGFSRWKLSWRFEGDETSTGNFGKWVAISDNGHILAIGDPIGPGDYTGTVTVFEFNTATLNWTQIGPIMRGGPGENWGKRSLSLSGDGTVVAVTSIDDPNFSSGSLHVLKYNGLHNDWDQLDSIGHEDVDFSPFTCALSYDGTTVCCSDTWRRSLPGNARVYRLEES